MTVDMEKYEELLQQIGEISRDHISGESLEELKNRYRSDIHSKRVLNEIVDISCLLKVLKKRAILHYNDPHSLRNIIEKYVRDESIKQQIGVLIINYKQWLDENSDSINFLYNSGKSNVLLTSHELNTPRNSLKVPEALYLHNNFDKSLQTSTEDMTRESLLANESLNNLNRVQSEHDTDRNPFLVINFKNFRLNISKKTVANVLLILILIFILIGIIWILIKLPRESAAVVPSGHSSLQAASGQQQLNMPFYMPNTRVAGYSTQSTFSVNHTQSYTTSTVPPVHRERELKNSGKIMEVTPIISTVICHSKSIFTNKKSFY